MPEEFHADAFFGWRITGVSQFRYGSMNLDDGRLIV
jgi:hypothetical protein